MRMESFMSSDMGKDRTCLLSGKEIKLSFGEEATFTVIPVRIE